MRMRRSIMKRVSRSSLTDEFSIDSNLPIPDVPSGGARIKLCYAGACYTRNQTKNCAHHQLRSAGMRDTSLFPGYEVSGLIDSICDQAVNNNGLKPGDRVVLYPDEVQLSCEEGFSDYITVKDLSSIIKISDPLSLQVASLLPCGALKAFSAVLQARPFVENQLKTKPGPINVLIVGAGGLGLWAVKLAQAYISTVGANVKLSVADTCVDKLRIAKDHGCFTIIHWPDSAYEETLVERTLNACPDGVDIIIDFNSTPRTVKRESKILNKGGVMIVDGNINCRSLLSAETLAQKQQHILEMKRGSKPQLMQLVNDVTDGKIVPPLYCIYPVEKASEVFDDLGKCKIYGRAIFEINQPHVDVC